VGSLAVDVGIGAGVVTRPATLASFHPSAESASLRRGRLRSRPTTPQLLTKPLRKGGRRSAGHTVWQMFTQNRQRCAGNALGVGASAQPGPGLHFCDELLVAHLVLLLDSTLSGGYPEVGSGKQESAPDQRLAR
jgi:hypothetical protein